MKQPTKKMPSDFYVIFHSGLNAYYQGHWGSFGGAPKFYHRLGDAKSAITGMIHEMNYVIERARRRGWLTDLKEYRREDFHIYKLKDSFVDDEEDFA
jgi:hypothetical protein